MTRIALVVSDVDGTLVTKDKTLTDRARDAVRRLGDAGIAFSVVSSRPTIGIADSDPTAGAISASPSAPVPTPRCSATCSIVQGETPCA